ncbi:UNVERIFIED_CONTAM: hypothetical protein Sindi_2271000 [Sesamum indicum]
MAPNSVDFPTLKASLGRVNSVESTRSPDKKQPSVAEAQAPPPSTKLLLKHSQTLLYTTPVSQPPNVGKQATLDGRQTLIFSDTETLSFSAAYRFALVGKFSHGAPQYRNLHRLVAGLGIHGAFTDIRCGYLNGPRHLLLLKNPLLFPSGVSFPELPAHLLHKDALHAVASMIGTPLQIDDFTFNQSKLSIARACIEIDLLTPLTQEFDIQINGISIVQKVEYEQMLKYCTLCKHVGHQDLECYSKGNNPKPAPHR